MAALAKVQPFLFCGYVGYMTFSPCRNTPRGLFLQGLEMKTSVQIHSKIAKSAIRKSLLIFL